MKPSKAWLSGYHFCLKFDLQLQGFAFLFWVWRRILAASPIHSGSRSRKTRLRVPSLGRPQSQLIPQQTGGKDDHAFSPSFSQLPCGRQ